LDIGRVGQKLLQQVVRLQQFVFYQFSLHAKKAFVRIQGQINLFSHKMC
jgi:hypothetical protein